MITGSIEITAVSFCKNMCTYCPQFLLSSKYGATEHMSLDTFKLCLSKIPKNIDILFAGFAEPFLNSSCSTMIKIAIEQGYLVNIYTTLVGITKNDIDTIKTLDINNIILHLPDNEGDMKCKVDKHYINMLQYFVQNVKYASAHAYGSVHEKIRDLLQYDISKMKSLHTRSNNIAIIPQQKRLDGNIVCDVIRRHNRTHYNHNVLLPNGDVVLCCMDYGLKHVLGNLCINNYEDLFKSQEYKCIMQGLTNDSKDILCRTCIEAQQL